MMNKGRDVIMSVKEKAKAIRWTDSNHVARQATGVFLGAKSNNVTKLLKKRK
jgi:hypothetical protein